MSNLSLARIMYGSNESNGHIGGRGLLPLTPALAVTAATEGSASTKTAHGSLEELLQRAWAVLSHKS